MADGSSEGRYANAFSVGFNAFEFVLDFGQRYTDQPDAQVHSRVVTSPTYAKVLLHTLTESLAQFEETYGQVPAASEPLEATHAEPGGETPESIGTRGRTDMAERPDSSSPQSSWPQRPGGPQGQQPPSGYPANQPPPSEPPQYPPPGNYPAPEQPTYPTPEPQPPQYPAPPQGGYPAPEQPTYPTTTPGYPQPEPQPPQYPAPPQGGYPAPEQPTYPTPPQGGYPTTPPQGGYPVPEQPTYPTPPQGGYPTTPPQGGYPVPEQPTYPTPPQGGYPTTPPPDGYPAPPRGSYPVPTECTKPKDHLAEMESALTKRVAELEALTSQKDSLQKDIDALKPTVTDYAEKVTEYKEKCKDVKEKKSILDQYGASKGPMLEAAVKEKKPQILHCIGSVDDWIAQWKRSSETLAAKAAEAETASAAADEEASEAQERYDTLKNTLADLTTVLEGLNATRKEIEAEEEKDEKLKTARMYVLFIELMNTLADLKIRTPEEFERELCIAWGQLSTAKSAAREAAAAATAAKDAAEAAAAKSQEYNGKRREKIFACIDRLCGPRQTPPPSTGYAPGPGDPA